MRSLPFPHAPPVGSVNLTLIRAYGTLLKPKITLLLTAFGLTAALVAAATLGLDVAAGRLALFALFGLMASGGAACLNHLFDRDIDRVMRRTRQRPIPQGLVSPRAAALYASVLLGVSLPLMYLFLGVMPALFSALGAAIYGGLYTLYLKRRTARNIELGGLAGSCGALAGWAVADPSLAWGAWAFAALVFCWTPAHFWGLAIARDADYRAVRIPMLPQVAGVGATARMMALYAVLTLAASLALALVTDLGLVYALGALVTGVLYTALCVAFWRVPSPAAALRVFKSSGAYLGLLIVAMLVDGRL